MSLSKEKIALRVAELLQDQDFIDDLADDLLENDPRIGTIQAAEICVRQRHIFKVARDQLNKENS